MISCSEAVRQLWEYIEGSLSQGERDRLDEHLGLCLRCCGEVEFARELQRFLAAQADEEPLPETVRTRLLSVLESLPSTEVKP